MLRVIREPDNYLQTLVNNMPGIAFRCLPDNNYTMLFISNQVEKVTGYKNSDFINNELRSFRSIIHPDDDKSIRENVDRYFSHKPFRIRYRIINSTGELVYIEARGQGVFDENGIMIFIDGTLIDVTESQLLLRKLSTQNERLKEMSWRQSHITRAPLAKLMGIVDLLLVSKSAEECYKWLPHLRESAEELDFILRGVKKPKEKVDNGA